MTIQGTSNSGSSITTYAVSGSVDTLVEINANANGAGSHPSGTEVNGDVEVDLPSAASTGGMMVTVAIKDRGPSHNNRTYLLADGSDTISGVSGLVQGTLNNLAANNTVTIVSNGADNWYYVGKN